jgi:predicted porin
MNKKLGLAVAGAILALSSTANAGITIPAGDWTVDIGGNVNAYMTNHDVKQTMGDGSKVSPSDVNSMGTGLLPAAIGIGAKSRQNDMDIAFNITFWTGTSSGENVGNGGAAGNNTLNIRQAYLTFGDASWGQVKMGRDLGVFGSDAILSDMTLLGVGTGGPAGGSSTLGRIGSGYIYADWKGQFQYTTPNWNGLQFTAAVTENFRPAGSVGAAGATYGSDAVTSAKKNDMGYEAKVTYDFTGDVSGRVWASAITQKTEFTDGTDSYTSRGFDVGAKAAVGAFGLVGYYYDGRGLDSQAALLQGLFNGNGVKSKDSGGYVQGTFAVPGIGTKLGLSYGESNSKHAASGFDIENKSWIVGAYHPLTKSLNLVAEYTNQDVKNRDAGTGANDLRKTENNTISLGAILFF